MFLKIAEESIFSGCTTNPLMTMIKKISEKKEQVLELFPIELRIKEHKLYLKSDRSSCQSFKANQFRLFLHSMAYVLLHTMQKELFKGTDFANATFKTLQNKIIKTAAWGKEMKTKIKIELPKFCPTKRIQTKSFDILSVLVT